MTIGFYNPYLDGFGGGERYTLSLASHWSRLHEVHLFWDDPTQLGTLQKKYAIDLAKIKIIPNIFRGNNVLKKALASRRYDLIFFLTDGSVPTTLAKRNILHFQIPFQHLNISGWKLSRYQAIVCNSLFTKRFIDSSVGRRAQVIYPPVATSLFKRQEKEKLILSVGRFHKLKKQDVLIEVFNKLNENTWRLVLAGGLLDADRDYFAALKRHAAKGIEFLPNISFRELKNLYAKATIYWHAAGYNETDPQRMEHFGITTVEAMAAGCVPIVFDGGGLPEIVEDGKVGYLWKTPEDLIQKSLLLATDHALRMKLSQEAQAKSKMFDEQVFYGQFDALLQKLIV